MPCVSRTRLVVYRADANLEQIGNNAKMKDLGAGLRQSSPQPREVPRPGRRAVTGLLGPLAVKNAAKV
jgi:hypothetical protein